VVDKLVRRVPVLTALGVMAVAMLWIAARPVADPDIWWHLRLGQDLSASGLRWSSVQHWSPFATEDWDPSAPLTDIVLFRVENWFGLPGIAWLFGLSLLAMLGTAYLCCRCVASDLPAVLATAVMLAGASGSLTARPQMVSFVLLPVVVCAWLRTERDLRPRWWLVPLTWAWAMCHGYWFIGVLVGVIFAGGMSLRARFAGGRLNARESAGLLAIPLLSICSAMLTPVGPGLALAPSRVSERGQFVQEGMRTAFDRAQPWVVLAMILTVALVWSLTRRDVSVARLGLLVMSAGWLLITERTVAVAAILVAPLLASALQAAIGERSADDAWATKRGVLSFVGFAGLGLGILAFVVPHTADEPGDVPTAFDSRLREQPHDALILNEYTIGGWLAWKYPHLDVVVDPLADAYSIEHLRNAVDAKHARGQWREFVAATDADLAVLDSRDPIVVALEEAGWVVEATDWPFVLMTPPGTRQ
jgi:hypothetical protein